MDEIKKILADKYTNAQLTKAFDVIQDLADEINARSLNNEMNMVLNKANNIIGDVINSQ